MVAKKGDTSAQGFGSLEGLMISGTGQGASVGMESQVTLSPMREPGGGSTNSTISPNFAHSTIPSDENPFMVRGLTLHTCVGRGEVFLWDKKCEYT